MCQTRLVRREGVHLARRRIEMEMPSREEDDKTRNIFSVCQARAVWGRRWEAKRLHMSYLSDCLLKGQVLSWLDAHEDPMQHMRCVSVYCGGNHASDTLSILPKMPWLKASTEVDSKPSPANCKHSVTGCTPYAPLEGPTMLGPLLSKTIIRCTVLRMEFACEPGKGFWRRVFLKHTENLERW